MPSRNLLIRFVIDTAAFQAAMNRAIAVLGDVECPFPNPPEDPLAITRQIDALLAIARQPGSVIPDGNVAGEKTIKQKVMYRLIQLDELAYIWGDRSHQTEPFIHITASGWDRIQREKKTLDPRTG